MIDFLQVAYTEELPQAKFHPNIVDTPRSNQYQLIEGDVAFFSSVLKTRSSFSLCLTYP